MALSLIWVVCFMFLVFFFIVFLKKTYGAIWSDWYRAPKTVDIMKYHSYDDLK